MKFALKDLQFQSRILGSECDGTSEGVVGVSEVEEVARLVGEELVEGGDGGVVVTELHLEGGC